MDNKEQKRKKAKSAFHIAKPLPPEKVKENRRKKMWHFIKTFFPMAFLILLILLGNYLLVLNRSYGRLSTNTVYVKSSHETNHYAAFGNYIVRFNRDGVILFNRRNREQWIQSGQMLNPIFRAGDGAFVVADRGGNLVRVFTERGLKGEFETLLPIERITVSGQGIVSVILRSDGNPLISTYDAMGNLLVEKQIPLRTMGYPTALALSPDGTMLAVGYLSIDGGIFTSRLVYYNFNNPPEATTDFVVTSEEFSNQIIADIHFVDNSTSFVVTDTSLFVYEGEVAPRRLEEINLSHLDLNAVFYGDRHVGLVGDNHGQDTQVLLLFDQSGRQVLSREFSGVFTHFAMDGNSIIMHDQMNVLIMTRWGVIRYQGEIDIAPRLILSAGGINSYYIISVNELRIVELAR